MEEERQMTFMHEWLYTIFPHLSSWIISPLAQDLLLMQHLRLVSIIQQFTIDTEWIFYMD